LSGHEGKVSLLKSLVKLLWNQRPPSEHMERGFFLAGTLVSLWDGYEKIVFKDINLGMYVDIFKITIGPEQAL